MKNKIFDLLKNILWAMVYGMMVFYIHHSFIPQYGNSNNVKVACLLYFLSYTFSFFWLIFSFFPIKSSQIIYSFIIKMEKKIYIPYNIASDKQMLKTIKKAPIWLFLIALCFLAMGCIFLLFR